MMQCARCRSPAVLYQGYSGRYLCADHLCADIESRAKRVIRQNRWLEPGDQIGVFSELPQSETLVIFLQRLMGKRTDIRITQLRTPDFYGISDESSYYQILSTIASKSGITRVAFPINAEDIAIKVLSFLFGNDVNALLYDGIPGSLLPVMLPFREIPLEELEIYARTHGVIREDDPPHPLKRPSNQVQAIQDMLMDFSSHHPSAPHALRHYQDNLCVLFRSG